MAGVIIPTLTAALQAIGNAHVYTGNALVAASLNPLGTKEGPIEVSFDETINMLTAPEQTGPAVHQATQMGVSLTATIPLILGDPLLYPLITPTGVFEGGYSVPQAIVPTTVLISPDAEVGGGLTNATGLTAGWVRAAGNGYSSASAAAAAPINSIWIWRAFIRRPARISYQVDNGGKVIAPVIVQAMFDASKPEGQRIFTVGDPSAKGVTTIRL
jgi:hypothetical protein